MSNFACPKCGKIWMDTEQGYVEYCECDLAELPRSQIKANKAALRAPGRTGAAMQAMADIIGVSVDDINLEFERVRDAAIERWTNRKVPGRAYTEAEKQKITDALLQAWLRSPELRLGQLIGTLPVWDLFYVEDEDLLKLLETNGQPNTRQD